MKREEEFNKFAEEYEAIHNKSISFAGEESMFFVELKVKLMQKYLKNISNQQLHILDYGCGIGRSAEFIKKYFPKSVFVGIDTSKKSIIIARKHHPLYTFTHLNKKWKIGRNKFDIIFASCVLHHIPPKKRLKVLLNIHASLKAGGYFILFEHNPYNFLTVRVVHDCPFDKGVVLLKPEESRKLSLASGFKTKRLVYYFFFPHSLAFFRKVESYLASLPLGAQYMLISKKQGN